MSNLVDHVLMNKLDDELSKAINEVGGDTSSARGPWDYPDIIKEQLGAKNANVDLIAGPGIIIRERNGKKFICSTSGALTTGALNPPSGSYKQPISEVIEAGTPVQEVFETLFYKILPRMSSVYKGDIIRSDKHGADRYNEEDTRTGLVPDSTYMRLYVANRQEPVYILLSGHGLVNEEGDLGSDSSKDPIEYVGGSSEYITVSVTGNVITASINEFGLEKMKALADRISVLEASVNSYDSKIEAVEGLIDEISDKSKEMESKFIQYDAEFTAMNTELDTKAASSELKKLEENSVSKTAYNSDMLTLNTKVNSVSSDIATTNTKINNLSGQVVEVRNSMSEVEAIAARAESISGSTMESVNALTSNVDALESSVVSVTQTINAVSQNVTNVEQSVSQVSQNVNELQQTSVTKEEVNTMVSQEVTNVVNNTEVVDGKVKEKLIEALGDPEDEEIQEALNAAVNKVMEDNSVTDGSSIADDIFAGL